MPLELSPNNKNSSRASDRLAVGAGTATRDTKIVPLTGRADTAVSQPTYPTVCARNDQIKAVQPPQHRTNPIATIWGKGRIYDCPPPLDSSAQWRVCVIRSGSGYRSAKHNGVRADLVARLRALPTQTASGTGTDTAVSARDPNTQRLVQSVGSSVHPH